MFNALMPGEHNYQMGRKMPGQGLGQAQSDDFTSLMTDLGGSPSAPRQPAPMQAKPKKNRPILNALGSYFQFAAPEEYQAGRMARMNKDYGNALASGDMEKAAQYRLQMGDFEGAQQIQQYTAGQQEAARKQEAQGVYQLFSQMDPMQINEMVMSNPAVFEQYTGMSSDEYNQIAQTLTQAGMRPEQIHQYVLQKAQAELGIEPAGPVEGKVVNNRLVNPFTAEEMGDFSDPATRYRVLTPEEVREYGLPAGSGYQVNETTGQIEALGRSGPMVEVNTGGGGAGDRPIVDNPAKGYQRVWDEQAQTYRDVPIPGSPDAITREEEAFREYLKLQTSEFNYDNVTSEIDRAIGLTDFTTAGVGGALLRELPMTSARTLNNAITMVKSNLGFDRLQQMREESKTGGALGAVTEKEIDLLQSTVQRLDQLTDPAELIRALEVVKEQYIKVQTLRQQMYAMKYSGAAPGQSRATPATNVPVTSADLPPGFEMVQ